MPRINLTNIPRTYGVEIEAYNVDPYTLASAITAAGVDCRYEPYNHATRTWWKVVPDGSLNSLSRPFELVSPPLQGDTGLSQIHQVCEVLAQLGAKTGKACGLHVHHDARDLQLPDWKRLLSNYAKYERVIDTFHAPSRRGWQSYYAKSLRGADTPLSAQTINNTTSTSYLLSLLNGREDFPATQTITAINAAQSLYDLQLLYGSNRYYKINLQSYPAHGTVEFRQHSGSIEAQKIVNWVLLTQRLVHFSKHAVNPCRLSTSTKWQDSTNKFWVYCVRSKDLRVYYTARAEEFRRAQARAEARAQARTVTAVTARYYPTPDPHVQTDVQAAANRAGHPSPTPVHVPTCAGVPASSYTFSALR